MSKIKYSGKLKGVILDWAGTTIDYGCFAPAAVFIEIFRRKGIHVTIQEARTPMGMHKKDHIEALACLPEVKKQWHQRYGRHPAETDIAAMFEEFVPLQLACLKEYCQLIPGTKETIADFRKRGLKVGTTTGYISSMMEIVVKEAKKQGYDPDAVVSADQVPAGRPHPWMCVQNAMVLGIYPFDSLVKIGDTVPDIQEGQNCGMWTIAVAKTGNEMGMTQKECEALDPAMKKQSLESIYKRFYQAGADYVVDSLSDVPQILDAIEERMMHGNNA